MKRKASQTPVDISAFNQDLDLALASLKVFSDFKQKYGQDLLRNMKYREFIIERTISKYDPTYKHVSDKIDFQSDVSKNGEVKSCKFKGFKSSRFEFDKQNDPTRRDKTLMYDGFAFAVFNPKDESSVSCIFYAQSKVSVDYINELIKSKQKDFIVKMTESEKNNKQISRDVIQLHLNEIVNVPEIVCLDSSGSVTDSTTLFKAS